MSTYTSVFVRIYVHMNGSNSAGWGLEAAATKDHLLWDRRPVGLANLSHGVKADETGPQERFDVGLDPCGKICAF